jgi:hypothetical protein
MGSAPRRASRPYHGTLSVRVRPGGRVGWRCGDEGARRL